MQVPQIISGMQEKNRQLSMKVDELEELAEKKAQAERAYKVAYARRVMEMRADGIAVTIVQKMADGDPGIAELKYQYDVADAVFNGCRERIKTLNTAIDTYRSLLSWNKAELEKAGIGH